ncbi:hypothetical protein YC2023_114826 [Brassica napus]
MASGAVVVLVSLTACFRAWSLPTSQRLIGSLELFLVVSVTNFVQVWGFRSGNAEFTVLICPDQHFVQVGSELNKCSVWLNQSSTRCSRLSFIFKNRSSGRPKLPDSGSQINCGSSFYGKRGADLVELLDRGFTVTNYSETLYFLRFQNDVEYIQKTSRSKSDGADGANLDDDWNEFGMSEKLLIVPEMNRKVQTHDLKVPECDVPYR